MKTTIAATMMTDIKRKITAVFLTLLTAFSMCISGCSSSAGDTADGNEASCADVTQTDVTPTDVIYVPDIHLDGIELPEEYGYGLYDSSAALWLVNALRERAGLEPYIAGGEELNNAALTRLKESAEEFSHTRPDGRDNKTVLDENGIKYSSCGENLAAGQLTAEHVVSDWFDSASHRAILLDPEFKYASIVCGQNDEDTYWTLLAYCPAPVSGSD